MNSQEHAKKFKEIIKKYNLHEESKAEDISKFLTKHPNTKVSASEFARLFAMTDDESIIFLSFIKKGIEFREKNLR